MLNGQYERERRFSPAGGAVANRRQAPSRHMRAAEIGSTRQRGEAAVSPTSKQKVVGSDICRRISFCFVFLRFQILCFGFHLRDHQGFK